MRKPTSRLLSMLMVLAMVLTMLPASVLAASDAEPPVKGWNLTLGDNIGVNFHIAIDEADVAQTSVDMTVAGNTVTAQAANAPQKDGCYVFTAEVAAAQMTDVITLAVVTDGEQVYSGTYSVRDYAMQILNGQYDNEVKEMVRSMLHYGAAAQVYFDHNPENLANAGIGDAAQVQVPTSLDDAALEGSVAGLFCYGTSLVFRSNVAVRFYFRGTGDIANYTFTVDGVPYTPVPKDVMYYVEVSDINPNELADVVEVVVSDGQSEMTVSYSPLQYIVNKCNGSASAELKALLTAMYGYHLEATEYVAWDAIEPVTVEAGVMANHSSGKTDTGLYFTMAANAAPYKSDWSLEYTQTSVDAVKLIRNGETTSIGIVGRPLLLKYSETEYYLKLENWTLGENAAITESDVLVIEGNFYHSASKTTLNIAKSYIYHDGNNWVISDILPSTVEAGVMSKHSVNGWASNGVYATMAENAAPYDGWSVEYTPVAAENLKLIRGGETYNIGIPGRGTLVKYSATEYFLKMEWNVGDYAPMQDGDILIVEGGFVNSASKVTLNIAKTYIYANGDTVEFSTEMPTLPSTVEAGVMNKHAEKGWQSNGVYATMAENAAPFDGWNVEYAPVASENLKLIRGGETYNIGFPGRGTIVKYNATDYFLKMEWNVGEYAPMQDGDVLIVEGGFVNAASKVTLNISKTYIYANGDTVEFSTEMPLLPTTVEGSALSNHDANGWASNGVYFKMEENAAPFDGWNVEYAPVASENLKLIRGGETYNIGFPGRGTIVKYNATDYFLKMEWNVGDYAPMQDGDILIVEGGFVNSASKVTLNFPKTYIQAKGDTVIFSTTEPVQTTVVEGGNMTEHADGWDATDGVYFTLAENAVPVDENAEVAYTAESGVIKLVRGGVTYDMSGAAIKYGATDYYLTLSGSSNLPLQNNDYLVVEGSFANAENGYILNIAKTYILVKGDSVVFSTSEPVLETEYALTGLKAHSNGWSADGIYISHDAHEATMNSDWSVEYKPVSADAIKLIRNGVTTSIGQPASGTLVVYNAAELYLKTAAWTIQGGVLPFVNGDTIVIEGKFKHEASGSVLAVEKTVICVSGSDLVFNPIFAGTMSNHANGVSGEGVYATMAENAAPFDGWSVEFTPMTADSYYVIRGGEQINIGIPGRGTLVKYSATEYFLKINAWCTDNFAYTTDDIIVVDGLWKHSSGTVMKMDKTYLYYNGSAWTFDTKQPITVEGGVMQTHGNGMSGNGMYFTMAANDAPYNTDWTLEYTQTSADGIKLIRDGVTTSIGIVGRPMFLKYGETNYYLKLENWTIGGYAPITTDDVLIIEGNFRYDNVTLRVSKSYVYHDGAAWICSAEEPISLNAVKVKGLKAHSNGWTSNGFYFSADTNDAPFNTDWSLRYKPLSADVIKLVHDGVTTNKGNTGAETIVKYSETDYYIEGWAVGMGSVVAGDSIIIDGLFYNAANDTYIDVEKTTIIFNEGGSTTVIAESSKNIAAGTMSAYVPGPNWFGDGIHFALTSNTAPATTEWTIRYTPAASSNIKLIRGGQTYNIANTGAESIVKIADGWYWLSLESWWWNAYAPIQDGDVLVVEGAFSNASNGYTLNIDKTYITFNSKDNDDVVFSVAADTQFGEVLLPTSSDTVTIGVWNGSHHIFTNERLAELQAAGVTKIIGIDPQWIGSENNHDMNQLLDRMQSYGISVVAYPRQRTADGTKYSGDDWDGVTVPDYASHPALIGFIMSDEPSAQAFSNLANLKSKFEALKTSGDMPEHLMFFVNLFPECAAYTSWYGSLLGKYKDYEADYVDAYISQLDPDVLSWDNYSLLSGSGIRPSYFHNFEIMAAKNSDSLPTWYTLLSAGHGTTSTSYATPSYEELRWQMAVAMTYGINNLDHYVYTSHESGYSTMLDYNTETVTDLYYDVKQADNEIKAWENIYMAYDWIGVGIHDNGSDNAMLTQLEREIDLAANGLADVSSSEDLLIGVFANNGNKAYMVTNAGTVGTTTVGDGVNFSNSDTTVTLTLDAADYKCAAIIDNGEISYVAVENNTITLNVEAYEGVFVIPVLN